MSKRPIDKLVKEQNYIKDSQLAEYLEGKLLDKPDYPSEATAVEVRGAYEETQERLRRERDKANKGIVKNQKLKK